MALFARLIVWSLIAAIAIGAGMLADLHSERIVRNVTTLTNAFPKVGPMFGVTVSIVSSILGFVYVAATQNRKQRGVIRAYRWAEAVLIYQGRMSENELLQYHRSYNWHAYAGLAFSTVFILVSLLFNEKYGGLETAIIYIGLALLTIATLLLGIIDFVHTNTLTPLVTIDARFRIIHWVIVFGGLALFLQICAVGVFLSLITPWLSVVSSVTGIGLMIFITSVRGVPLNSIAIERNLESSELSDVANAGPKLVAKLSRQRDEAFELSRKQQ
jgi:hypothetical protein